MSFFSSPMQTWNPQHHRIQEYLAPKPGDKLVTSQPLLQKDRPCLLHGRSNASQIIRRSLNSDHWVNTPSKARSFSIVCTALLFWTAGTASQKGEPTPMWTDTQMKGKYLGKLCVRGILVGRHLLEIQNRRALKKKRGLPCISQTEGYLAGISSASGNERFLLPAPPKCGKSGKDFHLRTAPGIQSICPVVVRWVRRCHH